MEAWRHGETLNYENDRDTSFTREIMNFTMSTVEQYKLALCDGLGRCRIDCWRFKAWALYQVCDKVTV